MEEPKKQLKEIIENAFIDSLPNSGYIVFEVKTKYGPSKILQTKLYSTQTIKWHLNRCLEALKSIFDDIDSIIEIKKVPVKGAA